MPNGDNVTLLMCGRVQRPSEQASEPREPSQPASQLYPVGENKELAATLLQQPSSTHSPLSARPGTETEKKREIRICFPGWVKLLTYNIDIHG